MSGNGLVQTRLLLLPTAQLSLREPHERLTVALKDELSERYQTTKG